MKAELIKILKFSLVGFSGVIVDLSFTYFFIEKLNFGSYLSHILAFCFAGTNNYYLNKYWTFSSQQKIAKLQFATFFITSLLGLLISTICLFILTDYLNYNFYFSKVFAIGTAAIWNYLVNRLWVFRIRDLSFAEKVQE